MASTLVSSLPQTTGPISGLRAGGDDRGAGTVGEDDRGGAVRRVGPVGELLRADDQDGAGRTGPDRVVRGREAVAEPGARRVEVERSGRVDAERPRDLGGGVRDLVGQAAGRDDHRVDVLRLRSGLGHGLGGGARAHRDDGVVVATETALRDADPGADPLVVGVHDLREIVVGDDSVGPEVAEAGDPRAGGAGHRRDRHGARPARVRPEIRHAFTPACSATKAAAASASSGDLTAMVATPFSSRLTSPTSVPGGRQFQHAGDSEALQRRHAEVPADRPGHLRDEQLQVGRTGADHRAVGVREQRPGRVGGGEARPRARRAQPRRLPCTRCGTRRRPAVG